MTTTPTETRGSGRWGGIGLGGILVIAGIVVALVWSVLLGVLPLCGVSHLDLRVDDVVFSSSDALAGDVARFDEIRDDSLGSPLRDPRRVRFREGADRRLLRLSPHDMHVALRHRSVPPGLGGFGADGRLEIVFRRRLHAALESRRNRVEEFGLALELLEPPPQVACAFAPHL